MKKIKIYGQQNSGTIYLEWLLKSNFEVQLLDAPKTGWKHRIAPSVEEVAELDADICYVCIVKNPYSWLLSMHKRPYMHEELKKLRFREFLKYPYGDYRNPIIMWNLKNKSYMDMASYTKNHIFLRYEDFLESVSGPLNAIANKFDLDIPPLYKNIHSLLTNTHGISGNRFHSDYYTKEIWRTKLSSKHTEIINRFLDKELMDKLNYSFL